MTEKKYKSFGEFLVRTPINLVTTLLLSLLAIFMIVVGILGRFALGPDIFVVWTAFFAGIPFGMVIRVWLIYKRVNKLN